jgi:hypothetical protein
MREAEKRGVEKKKKYAHEERRKERKAERRKEINFPATIISVISTLLDSKHSEWRINWE